MTAIDQSRIAQPGPPPGPEIVPLHSFGNGAVEERRAYLESMTGLDLSAVALNQIKAEQVEDHNIENLFGEIALPLGATGPLTVRGQHADGRYFVPVATTEGALVASISRAVGALNAAGGVETVVDYRGMTRAPVFKCDSMANAQALQEYVDDPERFAEIAKIAESSSKHAKLLEIKTTTHDNYVWLRFRYDTDEAMGMNMATQGADLASKFLTDQVPGTRILALSGNMCVDKKSNWMNIIDGRGYDVRAGAFIPGDILLKKLKVTPEDLAEVVFVKNWVGGEMAGAMSSNAHAANIIAAVFASTGQDLAHILDSSPASTTAKVEGDGVRFAVKLPSIVAGTVGGGTGLEGQSTLIKLMLTDVDNPEKVVDRKVSQLVEILGAAVLAGELNLLAALTNHELASGHERFGRSKNS